MFVGSWFGPLAVPLLRFTGLLSLYGASSDAPSLSAFVFARWLWRPLPALCQLTALPGVPRPISSLGVFRVAFRFSVRFAVGWSLPLEGPGGDPFGCWRWRPPHLPAVGVARRPSGSRAPVAPWSPGSRSSFNLVSFPRFDSGLFQPCGFRCGALVCGFGAAVLDTSVDCRAARRLPKLPASVRCDRSRGLTRGLCSTRSGFVVLLDDCFPWFTPFSFATVARLPPRFRAPRPCENATASVVRSASRRGSPDGCVASPPLAVRSPASLARLHANR